MFEKLSVKRVNFMTDRSDKDAIEKLHAIDETAAMDGDYAMLLSLFTSDAVLLPPGEPVVHGRDEIAEYYGRMQDSEQNYEVIDYHIKMEEVLIQGKYAFEWGFISGISKEEGEPDSNGIQSSYKVMRILKKMNSDEWKIHRVIWAAHE
jgi:uncharacterized protein (TIGR02246 family)